MSKKWDKANPDAIAKSKKKYDRKRPVWSFRPSPDLLQWLEDQQQEGESNAGTVMRLLESLRD